MRRIALAALALSSLAGPASTQPYISRGIQVTVDAAGQTQVGLGRMITSDEVDYVLTNRWVMQRPCKWIPAKPVTGKFGTFLSISERDGPPDKADFAEDAAFIYAQEAAKLGAPPSPADEACISRFYLKHGLKF